MLRSDSHKDREVFLEIFQFIDMFLLPDNYHYLQYSDKTSGRHYYQHISSGTVSWEKPPQFCTIQQLAKLLSHYIVVAKKPVDFSCLKDNVPLEEPVQPKEAPSEQEISQINTHRDESPTEKLDPDEKKIHLNHETGLHRGMLFILVCRRRLVLIWALIKMGKRKEENL